MMPGPAMDLDQVGRTPWDAVVIGAGPAGALAAQQIVRSGLRTLLIDAKSFPRHKVCGGCLNQRALAALEQAGLGHLLAQLGAVPLHELYLAHFHQRLRLPLPGGAAVSRFRLDVELVRCAVEAGVCFLPGTTAHVEHGVEDSRRRVSLQGHGTSGAVTTSVVVSADGLLQSSLKAWPEFQPRVAAESHVGLGALLTEAQGGYPEGRITMAVARDGYVGLARVEDGGLNIAAAVSPQRLRAGAGAPDAVRSILADAGMTVPDGLAHAAWLGTPPLTRRAGRVAGPRLFLIGDATGYVEPFTGEGMAWGLHSALAVAPLVVHACQDGDDGLADQWERTHRQLVQSRSGTCRFLAGLLRHPWAASAAMRTCHWLPWLPRYAAARINRQQE